MGTFSRAAQTPVSEWDSNDRSDCKIPTLPAAPFFVFGVVKCAGLHYSILADPHVINRTGQTAARSVSAGLSSRFRIG